MATIKWQVQGTILECPVPLHYGIYLCLFALLLPVAEWILQQVQK